ncbi:SUKH-3 domain-containing protein [Streptomyces sp. NPDC056549]|uniref:SUKH-3 domain-containing protein n=1 Tax=Streptomyces sp. NPDC056549 TaxID=3345864 RepID=UPI0036BD9FA6
MPRVKVPADVDAWFGEYGWAPGQKAKKEAAVFVAEVVEESRRGGRPVEPFAAASDSLTKHAGLRVTHEVQRQEHLYFTPVPVWATSSRTWPS